jgi:hypothetical protein
MPDVMEQASASLCDPQACKNIELSDECRACMGTGRKLKPFSIRSRAVMARLFNVEGPDWGIGAFREVQDETGPSG